jgi:hypothetical protein
MDAKHIDEKDSNMPRTKQIQELPAKYATRATRSRRSRTQSAPKITRQAIDKRLRQLPPEKLAVVYDFVSYLLARDLSEFDFVTDISARPTMFASEQVLQRDWSRPSEDKAWAHL